MNYKVPEDTFHTCIVSLLEPETMEVVSGEKATDQTVPVSSERLANGSSSSPVLDTDSAIIRAGGNVKTIIPTSRLRSLVRTTKALD